MAQGAIMSALGLGDENEDTAAVETPTDEGPADQPYSPSAYARLSQMLQNLREQRVGPDESQKWFSIAAALVKPTPARQGRFGQVLGNVTEAMSSYNDAKSKAEMAKAALIARYEGELARLEQKRDAANQKANAPAGPKDTDQRKRLGFVQYLYPKLPPEEQFKLIYSPTINKLMMAPGVVSSAVSGGYAVPEGYEPLTEVEVRTRVDQAREAIKKGAPREDVLARLRSMGVPPPEDL